jgi:hypothetical protein
MSRYLLSLFAGLLSMFVIIVYKVSKHGEEEMPGGRTLLQLRGSMSIRHRDDNEKEESIYSENISTLEQEMRKG